MAGLTDIKEDTNSAWWFPWDSSALSVSSPCESTGDFRVRRHSKSLYKMRLLVPPAVNFHQLKGLGKSEQRKKNSGAGRTGQNLQQIWWGVSRQAMWDRPLRHSWTPYPTMCSSPRFGHQGDAHDWLLHCGHGYTGYRGPLPKRDLGPGSCAHPLGQKWVSSSQRQRSRKQRGVGSMQKIKQQKKSWSINWLETIHSKGQEKKDKENQR